MTCGVILNAFCTLELLEKRFRLRKEKQSTCRLFQFKNRRAVYVVRIVRQRYTSRNATGASGGNQCFTTAIIVLKRSDYWCSQKQSCAFDEYYLQTNLWRTQRVFRRKKNKTVENNFPPSSRRSTLEIGISAPKVFTLKSGCDLLVQLINYFL